MYINLYKTYIQDCQDFRRRTHGKNYIPAAYAGSSHLHSCFTDAGFRPGQAPDYSLCSFRQQTCLLRLCTADHGAANCKIILPPEKYIATNEKNGNPEGIWEWLEHKAPKADAAVISTDSLVYGGLVASRTHNISQEELQKRINHLYKLKTTLPIKLYAFSTIMRTPRASKGRVEPPYYSTIGPTIFAYSQLLDKQDQGKLSPTEKLTMQALERNMKKAELGELAGATRKKSGCQPGADTHGP